MSPQFCHTLNMPDEKRIATVKVKKKFIKGLFGSHELKPISRKCFSFYY
jgi:hypothetical protein